jgi:hypothetical protein
MRQPGVAKELLALERNGLIKPKAAVEWARRHPRSELYAALEWDDSVAAEQYRIQQVRSLIAIFIEPTHQTRQFVSLSIDRVEGGGYRRIESVMNTPTLRQTLLEDALHEFSRAKEKYAMLEELDRVWVAVSQVRPGGGAAPQGTAPRKGPTRKGP